MPRLAPRDTKAHRLLQVLEKMSLPRTAKSAYAALKAQEHRLGFDPLKDRKRLTLAKRRAGIESYQTDGGWSWRRRDGSRRRRGDIPL